MHILKIIHGYPPHYNAGSEVYSQSICQELSKRHKVSVFSREENPYAPDFEIRHERGGAQLDFYWVNHPQGKDGYRHEAMDAQFAELLRRLRPDIAHIGHLNHLSTGLVEVLRRFGIPIVFTLHDFWLMCPRGQFLTRSMGQADNFQLCSGQDDAKCARTCYPMYFSGREADYEADLEHWTRWIGRRMAETRAIIPQVDLFIAPSRYLMNRFMRDFGLPEQQIIYLDYGFPTEYLSPIEPKTEKSVFTFGYIGTHIPAKGINLLIEAFSRLESPCALKIFGRHRGQMSEALQALAAKSKNPISFEGEYINQNLAEVVFSQVDCIVVPSIWGENSPLVIHEAQACRIPVITANYGGMSEYVQHRVNGLLFEHRSIESLENQLNFALNNPELLRQYGQRGYLYSEDGQVPNIQDHCQTLEAIYRSFIPSAKLWRLTIDTNPEDCNLKCVMCEEHSPYSDFMPKLYQETGVKRRRMAFETVERIFAQAADLGLREIIPSTMGEPLLYKGIEGIFELSKQTGIKINLTTNGTFPKKSVEDWAELICPQTTDIKISWNGATAETAQSIMLGLDFEQVLNNLRRLVAARDRVQAQSGWYCRLTLQLTFMQNNMHELADIVKLAAELGIDRVKGHQLWAHFEEIQGLSMRANQDSIAQWNAYVRQAHEAQARYRKPNGDKVILENIIPLQAQEDKAVPEDYVCPFLNQELWISATGKISPCCAPDNLRQSLGDFGNIAQTSLAEVLRSPAYLDLVQNYKRKSLCQTCNMRKPQS